MAFYNYTEGYLDIASARIKNVRKNLKPDTRETYEKNRDQLEAFKASLDALVNYAARFGRSETTDNQFNSLMTEAIQFINENI